MPGANSFTEAQARSRIENLGYSNVVGLSKDDQGVWRGSAMKDGKSVSVALDFNGILYHIGFKSHWIDVFLTLLILMGGAERLAELLKTPGAPGVASASEDKPLEVRGTLQLVDTPAKEAATGALPRPV